MTKSRAKRADPINRKSIRQALRDWESSQKLGAHPLAHLQLAEARRRAAGYGPTPVGYGVALRDVLHDALQKLKPETGEPNWQEKRWRPYFILSQQYLDGRSPDYLITQLNIARSTYDHEQASAFELLADVLRQWEQLGPRAEPAPTTPTESRPPFLAPPRPAHPLVGRKDQLALLKQKLFQSDPPIAALHGLPGVGKTALAIEAAHDADALQHFSDGVLWATLGRQPDVLALLGMWGLALGLSAEQLARLTKIEDRARAVQAALGMRRLLLVMDDVWQVEDALAFKIGGPHCAYLITTRLPKIAPDFAGENVIALHELNEADGLTLLTHFAPVGLAAEPDEARALAQTVGGLPLALALMGRYLQKENQPGRPRRLRAALERLRQTSERLQLSQSQSPLELAPNLPARMPLSLLTAIAVSDEALDDNARRALRALSVFPPKPNSFSEAAALTACAAPVETLDALMDYGLLECQAAGRYTLHQTIAEYAGLKLADEAAFTRMADFFVRYTEVHTRDYNALEAEANNVLAALHAAYTYRQPALLIRGSNALYPYLSSRGLYQIAEFHLQRAEQAARAINDTVSLSVTLSILGNADQRRGEYAPAEAHYQEALALAQKIGARESLSGIFQGLGVLAFSQGDYARAEAYYQEGLTLARAIGRGANISALLTNLGALLFNRGDYRQAETYFQEGLALARAMDHRPQINALLTNLGVVAARHGQYDRAETYFQESLQLAREAGHRENICFLLINLGTLANDRQDYAQAETYFQEGLALARQMSDRVRLSHLLANLGALAHRRRDFSRAEAYLQEGLTLARQTQHRENICQLLTNLGALACERGDYTAAEASFQESLALAQEMGHRRYLSLILNHCGELHLKRQAPDAARAAFAQSLEVAQAIGAPELITAAQAGLGRCAN